MIGACDALVVVAHASPASRAAYSLWVRLGRRQPEGLSKSSLINRQRRRQGTSRFRTPEDVKRANVGPVRWVDRSIWNDRVRAQLQSSNSLELNLGALLCWAYAALSR